MAAVVGGKIAKFRDVFSIGNKEIKSWFPGHIASTLKQMEGHLKNVDCLIEVHDARIPISGRYANFRKTLCGLKPHILVLTKIDLCDTKYMSRALEMLRMDGIEHIIQTNLKDETMEETREILPLMNKLIKESDRYNRTQEADYSVMVIGVPNVGKSSLINRLRNTYLRKPKAAKVAPEPGVTRALQTRVKINENPPLYMFDTPGILPPNIPDVYTGLKLALVGCSPDHRVGLLTLADYLLFWLNKNNRFEYVEKLGIKEPNDDITEVLLQICVKVKKVKKVKNYDNQYIFRPDMDFAAERFLKAFRNGELGLYNLDTDLLKN